MEDTGSMKIGASGDMEQLSQREMEVMMTVFRSFETGLREATIYPKVKFIVYLMLFTTILLTINIKDLHAAMKMLGLNPMEQEIVDLTNTITKNGFIYFPDFCKIVMKGWRSQDEEMFRQIMFKVSSWQKAITKRNKI